MNPLRFRSDGTFTIVQLTDLHIHNFTAPDDRTVETAGLVLDLEKPDLVIYTGDLASGWECPDPRRAVTMAASAATSRNLDFAAVFGNHDDEGGVSRLELFHTLKELPNCRMARGPEDVPGVGNYVLEIRGADETTAAALHCLDSLAYDVTGKKHEKGGKPYAWIPAETGVWHKREVHRLEQSRRKKGLTPMPALAFFHIPVNEYDEVWDTKPCLGRKYETVCPPETNGGFFAALREAGQVLGTFVGHDHINDYEGTLEGIRLCYGRGGGYNSYGKEGWQRGARVIKLTEGVRSFETWIRLADGSREVQPLHQPAGRVLTTD